jgi:antitoxin component YwqK of YwqJK toxin-antitoxin module
MAYVIEMAWVDEKMEEKFSGDMYYLDNGCIWKRTNWKDGLRNGIEDEYHRINGKLIRRTHWRNGKKDGLEERRDEDGVLKERTCWKNGVKNGLEEEFYAGLLKYTREWLEGKSHGVSKVYSHESRGQMHVVSCHWWWMGKQIEEEEWERREMERLVGEVLG